MAGAIAAVPYRILGPLEVARSGSVLPLGGPRQRAVLALLLLEANRVVSMDRLAEDLWGGAPPPGGGTPGAINVSHPPPARGVGHHGADLRLAPAPGAGAGPGPRRGGRGPGDPEPRLPAARGRRSAG